MTAEGMVLGSADYIAPEQIDDPHAADIRADIYSLGCTLYFLLAGRPPFPDGSLIQKLLAHGEKTPRPLAEIRADVPPELARVVERMMAKDPARRFQTPDEVAQALAPFADARGRRTATMASSAAASAGDIDLSGGLLIVRLDGEGNSSSRIETGNPPWSAPAAAVGCGSRRPWPCCPSSRCSGPDHLPASRPRPGSWSSSPTIPTSR